MNKLYIDTSSTELALSVEADGRRSESISALRKSMVERLFPELERLLKTLDLEFKDIDRIYTTNGPGSYTGSRIGLNVAKVFKILKPQAAVYTASALRCLLAAAEEPKAVALIDARNRAFFALMSQESEGSERRLEFEEVSALIERGFKPVIYESDAEALKTLCGADIIATHALTGMRKNPTIFQLSQNVNDLKPFYLKDPNR